jgi:hypothetical protein
MVSKRRKRRGIRPEEIKIFHVYLLLEIAVAPPLSLGQATAQPNPKGGQQNNTHSPPP